jgi:hypothetical protein
MAKVSGSAAIVEHNGEHELNVTVEIQPEAPGEFQNFSRFLHDSLFKMTEGKFVISETFREIDYSMEDGPRTQTSPPAEPPTTTALVVASQPDEPADPTPAEVNDAISSIEGTEQTEE